MGKQEAAGAAELRSRVQVGAAGERLHTQGVPRVKAVDYPFPVLLCGEQGGVVVRELWAPALTLPLQSFLHYRS